MIDCDVGSPGHETDVMDGLNSVVKKYLIKSMFRIVLTEEKHTEKHTNSQTESPNGAKSLVLEYQRLLQSHSYIMRLSYS